MLAFVVLATLAAAPAGEGEGEADALLLLDLRSNGVDAATTKTLDGVLAEAVTTHLARLPKKKQPVVHSADELRTLAGIEAERAAAGCDDASSSCLAELAGALGARYVVTGSLGQLGARTVLQLSLFDSKEARTLKRASESREDPALLADALPVVVAAVLAPLGAPEEAAAAGPPVLAIAGGIVAGAGVLAGAGSVGAALFLDERLAAGSGASAKEKQEALDLVPPLVVVGAVGGVVCVVGAVVLAVGLAE